VSCDSVGLQPGLAGANLVSHLKKARMRRAVVMRWAYGVASPGSHLPPQISSINSANGIGCEVAN